MKTTFFYAVDSAVLFEIGNDVSLTLDTADVLFKINQKKFLTEVVIAIPGGVTETEGKAHKLIKYITDYFLKDHSPLCDVRKFEVHESSVEVEGNKPVTAHQTILQTEFTMLNPVTSLADLTQELSTANFRQRADMLSAFAQSSGDTYRINE